MKFGNLYLLNEESVRGLVDAQHLTHTEFAAKLGVSRTSGRRS